LAHKRKANPIMADHNQPDHVSNAEKR